MLLVDVVIVLFGGDCNYNGLLNSARLVLMIMTTRAVLDFIDSLHVAIIFSDGSFFGVAARFRTAIVILITRQDTPFARGRSQVSKLNHNS